MNYELENDEDENLIEANHQLKTLLLESSNKILEFKDVINKQETNLIKVTNDFVCKNDELTECLATVEELKRQLSTARKNTSRDQNGSHYMNEDTLHDDIKANTQEHEMLEHDLNLIDSQQNSDYESDGQEIEVLENIFEKSCGQYDSK